MFDYTRLTNNAATELCETAAQIRGRSTTAVLATGHDLNRTKELLDHGQFTQWVVSECELSIRSAQVMMGAARWAEGKNATVALLPAGVIYLLAAPSVLPEIEERVSAKLAAGDRVSTSEVRRWVAATRRRPKQPTTRVFEVVEKASLAASPDPEPELSSLSGDALATALQKHLSEAATVEWTTIAPAARLDTIAAKLCSLADATLEGCDFQQREQFVLGIALAAGVHVAPGMRQGATTGAPDQHQ